MNRWLEAFAKATLLAVGGAFVSGTTYAGASLQGALITPWFCALIGYTAVLGGTWLIHHEMGEDPDDVNYRRHHPELPPNVRAPRRREEDHKIRALLRKLRRRSDSRHGGDAGAPSDPGNGAPPPTSESDTTSSPPPDQTTAPALPTADAGSTAASDAEPRSTP